MHWCATQSMKLTLPYGNTELTHMATCFCVIKALFCCCHASNNYFHVFAYSFTRRPRHNISICRVYKSEHRVVPPHQARKLQFAKSLHSSCIYLNYRCWGWFDQISMPCMSIQEYSHQYLKWHGERP